MITSSPNPAQEKITIELTKAGDYRFRIFDLNGKILLEKTLTSKSNGIFLGKISSGNYFVQLKSLVDGKMFSGTLLKE